MPEIKRHLVTLGDYFGITNYRKIFFPYFERCLEFFAEFNTFLMD
jgi:hypothetical protein